MLIGFFRGTLEALQGILHACSHWFRAESFEEPTPPAWWEDEVSTILDATRGGMDGRAGNVRLLLQPQWEKGMQPELVRFVVDRFDLKDEVPGAAEGFSGEGDSLAYGSWTFWLAL
ncbi:MAG: hypothetical protein JOZ87_38075, partial [Chloroflexi bacterium]|nr:hypothetical protein [Chloroflexota bacterium]